MSEDLGRVGEVDSVPTHVLPILVFVPLELHPTSVYTGGIYVKSQVRKLPTSPVWFGEAIPCGGDKERAEACTTNALVVPASVGARSTHPRVTKAFPCRFRAAIRLGAPRVTAACCAAHGQPSRQRNGPGIFPLSPCGENGSNAERKDVTLIPLRDVILGSCRVFKGNLGHLVGTARCGPARRGGVGPGANLLG